MSAFLDLLEKAYQETDNPYEAVLAAKVALSVQLSSWTQYQGEGGGRGWKNTATGEIRYQTDMPTERGEGQQPIPQQQQADINSYYQRAASLTDAEIANAKAIIAKSNPAQLKEAWAKMGYVGPTTKAKVLKAIEDRRGSYQRTMISDPRSERGREPQQQSPEEELADIEAQMQKLTARRMELMAARHKAETKGQPIQTPPLLQQGVNEFPPLPKDKKRVTIDTATSALAARGYKLSPAGFDFQTQKTLYEITYPDGKKITLSSKSAIDFVYQLAEQGSQLSLDAYFAHDIFNKQAQGILNRALKASKELSAKARDELKAAVNLENPIAMGQKIVEIVTRYRQQFANLLGSTNTAALLSGAREVAAKLPPIFPGGVQAPPPPSLPFDEAVLLLEELKDLPNEEQMQEVYKLPADQQEYVRIALRNMQFAVPTFAPPKQEEVQFPIIDEAVKELSGKNLVTREEYNRLNDAARAKAFTVTGVDARETLEKIRDTLAENVAEGADYETFKTKMAERVDEGTFLSDAHQEVVFRMNIQSAFSDGQMNVLNQPFVKSGFPYAMYNAIHDDRVRANHLALEKLGIQSTNVYRIDDPVFQKFRPPWDFGDRCDFTPITIRLAAEKGIAEAIEWLKTGVEPSQPAFVPMPSFQPPASFHRLESAPLSIRLSMESIDAWTVMDIIGPSL